MLAVPPAAPSSTAAAPAPERASKPVPGPGRRASDAITSAIWADPAATASAATVNASMPACVEPDNKAPPACGEHPSAEVRTARLGPSAYGGRDVPQYTASMRAG